MLEKIARDHLPCVKEGSSWKEASLGETHLKSKVRRFDSKFMQKCNFSADGLQSVDPSYD